MSQQQSLDQQRASYAQKCVRQAGGDAEKYRDAARGIGGLILADGLGQAMAFLASKMGGQNRLYRDFQKWLCDRAPGAPYRPQENHEQNLIESIAAKDSTSLRRATVESLALCVWLKRFADIDEAKRKAPQVSSEKQPTTAQDSSLAQAPSGVRK